MDDDNDFGRPSGGRAQGSAPRAAAPGSPAHPQAPRPGCGICPAVESSAHPPTRPRTFPQPLEIPDPRPPPSGISTATHSRDDEGEEREREKTN
jgi:hypothetical protein